MDKIIAKAEIDTLSSGVHFLRLTSDENNISYESFNFYAEDKIIKALNLKPSDEIVITFEVTKREER